MVSASTLPRQVAETRHARSLSRHMFWTHPLNLLSTRAECWLGLPQARQRLAADPARPGGLKKRKRLIEVCARSAEPLKKFIR